jgi:hypothetical protein
VEQFSDRRNEKDRADRLINHYIFDYRGLCESNLYAQLQSEICAPLHKLDPHIMTPTERKAFFINLYNAFILHALIVCGRPTNLILRQQFFKLTRFVVGRYRLSLDNIYHAILRGALFRNENGGPIWTKHMMHMAETSSWNPSMRLYTASKYHEKILDDLHLRPFDKRIHFAMYSGNLSSPKLTVFTPENLEEELEAAAAEFIRHYTDINLNTRTITLHKVFDWYREDFAPNEREVLNYIVQYLEVDQKSKLFHLIRNKREKYSVVYHYDWKLNNKINAKDASLLEKNDIKIELDDVKNDPVYRAFFYQFCELEHSTENLDFWMAVQRFKKISERNDRIAQFKEARKILKTYLVTRAEKEINVSRSLVRDVESQIANAAEIIRIKSKSSNNNENSPNPLQNSEHLNNASLSSVESTEISPSVDKATNPKNIVGESDSPEKNTKPIIPFKKTKDKRILLPIYLFDRLEEEIGIIMTDTYSRFKHHNLYNQMVQACVTEFIYESMAPLLDEDSNTMSFYEVLRTVEKQKEKQQEKSEAPERINRQQRFKSFMTIWVPPAEDVTLSEEDYLKHNREYIEKKAAKRRSIVDQEQIQTMLGSIHAFESSNNYN